MKPKNVKKNLERRVADYNATVARLTPDQAKGYKKPGSFKK